MEDEQIIALYTSRAETAVSETATKYGKYCHTIAYSILHNHEDAEECVNDTYIRAWNAIPPKHPNRLSTFLGKITRNLSLNRYAHYTAEKRGGGQVPLVLEELQECIPAAGSPEQAVDDLALSAFLNRFLADLPVDTRTIFVQRYWYLRSIKEIAESRKCSESKVKMSLLRTRTQLKQILEKEGVIL